MSSFSTNNTKNRISKFHLSIRVSFADIIQVWSIREWEVEEGKKSKKTVLRRVRIVEDQRR